MGEHKNRAHKALYRKYRSRSFDEIVGQEHITKTLKNAVKSGRISHAYLFTGPRGSGKTSIARILAHEINGLPYDGERLDLDIIEIDAASNRRIDDIRDLREKVHIAPVSAKYKVYIIDEVHMLTNESFNALLKTLEEPPEHVIFMLATTEAHKLPATIVSRAQRHSFRSVSKEQIAKHLRSIAEQEGITVTDEALELLAEHGEGSFRDSISLLDQLSSGGEEITVELVELILGLAPHKELEALLNSVEASNGAAVIAATKSLLETGLSASSVAVQLLGAIKALIVSGKQKQWHLALMDELLQVHSAPYPRLKLETSLLAAMPAERSAIETAAAPATSGKPKEKEPQHTSALVADQPQKSISPAKMRKEVAELGEATTEELPSAAIKEIKPADVDLAEQWPEILQAIKERNNPLHTIVRQALPSMNAQGLVLSFGVSFHQKRVDDIKHRVIVAEAAQAVFGFPLQVEAMYDPKLAKSKPQPAPVEPISPPSDPAHASLVQGIQDIMGGGEIVNA